MSELKRIAYLEDDPDIQRIGKLTLERLGGWECTPYLSGAEFLSRTAATPPDLVLMDVMMPDMDGPETLRRMRNDPNLSRIPVVFMTAKVRPEEVARYMQLGCLAVIRKPFDPKNLVAELRMHWQTWLDRHRA